MHVALVIPLHMMMAQPSLTVDCLERVIDFVTDSGTLFSLLTVNKTVFALAVRTLYRSPFLFETISKVGVRKLACLLISLLPPDAGEPPGVIQQLRSYVINELFDTTYIDYIALVRDIRTAPKRSAWALAYFTGHSHVSRSTRSRNFQPILAWAVAGHRLQEIKALSIHEANIRPLKDQIGQLTSLERVRVYYEPTASSIHDFVQEFVRVHGERGRKRLRLEICGDLRRDVMDYLGTFELLDPEGFIAPPRIELFDFGPLYAYREKIDFSLVKVVFFHRTGYEVYLKPILAKCRQLERLSLILTVQGLQLLDWAVERAQKKIAGGDGDKMSSQQVGGGDGGIMACSLPPLKELAIDGDGLILAQTLDDALQAFGSTLERITVGDAALDDREPADMYKGPFFRQQVLHRLRPISCLPRLRSLSIEANGSSVVFHSGDDQGSVLSMPMLERLHLFPRFDRDVDEDMPQRQPFTTWPVMYLPCLNELWMNGWASAEFNPASLASARSLESIYLHLGKWDAAAPLQSKLWTWDWYLPCLTSLEMSGPASYNFSLYALEYMPALYKLTLEGSTQAQLVVDRYYSERSPWRDTPPVDHAHSDAVNISSDRNEAQPLGNVTSLSSRPGASVRELCLRGDWEIRDEVWQELLCHWFPNLQTLKCDEHSPVDLFVALEWVRRHSHVNKWISSPKGKVADEISAAMGAKSCQDLPSQENVTLGKDYFTLHLVRQTFHIPKIVN